MLIVMIAIGTTNLVFAVDSIPAIFGLTKEPFIILTANAFALMGLRQLYFIIGGLMERMVFLNYGLAFVLGFIGFKLITETLHHHGVEWAPEFSITASLLTIAAALGITAVVSLVYSNAVAARTDSGAVAGNAELAPAEAQSDEP
jgi:tellurite resistance protein TerC